MRIYFFVLVCNNAEHVARVKGLILAISVYAYCFLFVETTVYVNTLCKTDAVLSSKVHV